MIEMALARGTAPRLQRSCPPLLTVLLTAACASSGPRAAVQPEPSDSMAVDSLANAEADRLEAMEREVRELRDRAVKAELRVMERDAKVRQLEQRLAVQGKMLEETIAEVVRAKAKLRGIESKAQAASQLAEAEIALKALSELPLGKQTPEYQQAAALVRSSNTEFKEENFGGAIYLSSQAKTLIGLAQARIGDRTEIDPAEDEVSFEAPLPLEVATSANVRAGPGLEHTVIRTLPSAAPVTGYSYRGEWVRVRLDDGQEGWIYQSLLKGR